MTIYALSIGSNHQRSYWITHAMAQLKLLGPCQFSQLYEIPCRDGKGNDYYNLAALLHSVLPLTELMDWIKQQEKMAGRVRPSHQISLDIDVIALGETLQNMQLVAQRLPLPFDVCKPLTELWSNCPAYSQQMSFKIISEALE